MGILAFATLGAIVLVVKFLACSLIGLRSQYLSSDMMREMTIHAIFAIARKIMDTRILESLNMISITLTLTSLSYVLGALLYGKVLLWAETLDPI